MKGRGERANIQDEDEMSALDVETVLDDLCIICQCGTWRHITVTCLDPTAEQHGISSDEVLITKPNNEWVEEWPPRIVLLPLSVQELLADVLDRCTWCKLTL